MMRGRMSQSVSLLSSRRGFAAVGGGVRLRSRLIAFTTVYAARLAATKLMMLRADETWPSSLLVNHMSTWPWLRPRMFPTNTVTHIHSLVFSDAVILKSAAERVLYAMVLSCLLMLTMLIIRSFLCHQRVLLK